jgi:hypothetical protein
MARNAPGFDLRSELYRITGIDWSQINGNAARTLLRSQSYLGAQYRRLRTRLGAPKAITAMARKLACLFYRLIKHGQQYVDKGTAYYEARYREQQIRVLTKRAQKLGLQVIIPQTA